MLSVRDRPAAKPGRPSAGETVSAAKIAAAAALLGAVIGLAGAGIPALISTQAEDRRTQSQFLREQRQAAYAVVIDAEDKFLDLALTLAGADVVQSGPVDAQLTVVQTAATHVKILGSRDTVVTLDSLIEADRQISGLVSIADSDDRNPEFYEFTDAINHAYEAYFAFQAAARSDLGSE